MMLQCENICDLYGKLKKKKIYQLIYFLDIITFFYFSMFPLFNLDIRSVNCNIIFY